MPLQDVSRGISECGEDEACNDVSAFDDTERQVLQSPRVGVG